MRPRLLDLFCKAGGASVGYQRAGFDVTGVDIAAQRHYPFPFVQADALAVLRDKRFVAGFDAIHASPPCQVHSALSGLAATRRALRAKPIAEPVNLIPPTRRALVRVGLPYVMENVPGAPLNEPVTLCGSMFGLGVRRHRLFELGGWTARQPRCRHDEQDAASPGYPVLRYHSGKPIVGRSTVVGVHGRGQGLGRGEVELWRSAMDIGWMTRDELAQAIPPAYTRWIGRRLAKVVAS